MSEQILKLQERWLVAERENRIEEMADLLTDDLCCLPPGGPRIEGKTEFLRQVAGAAADIEEITLSNLRIVESGRLAIKIADFETSFTPPSRPAVSGTHVWGLRRQASGWKIQLISWTLNLGKR